MKDKPSAARPEGGLEQDMSRPFQERLAEYGKLKQLLMREEMERIAELERKLAEPDEHTPLLGRDLPRAIREASVQDKKLSRALSPTVESILHSSVRDDPKSMADALYPVMGPSIRRSISEALRGMVQSFNEVLANSFSWQGAKWRLEAMRTKKTFAEVVLLKSLVYRVEQCFLIHRETGLVLQHLAVDSVEYQDADMVSAMLTAIQDFVKDSFSTGDEALDSLQVGELRIIIEKGADAAVALVVRGQPPVDLVDVARDALGLIQEEMRQQLQNFNGDAAVFERVRPILSDCMRARYHEAERKNPLALICAILLLVVAIAGGGYYLDAQQRAKDAAWKGFVALLGETPGIVVTSGQNDGSVYSLHGLQDPLAERPEDLWQDSDARDLDVRFSFQPYQSMEPSFVLRRAKVALAPPESVTFQLEGGVLRVVGEARLAWRLRARDMILAVSGLDAYDDGKLVCVEEKAFQARAEKVEAWCVEFREGGTVPLNPDVIQAVALEARKMQELSRVLENNFTLILSGMTDSSGDTEQNTALRVKRAEAVRKALVQAGVDECNMQVRSGGIQTVMAMTRDASMPSRRVEFTVGAVSRMFSPLNFSERAGVQ